MSKVGSWVIVVGIVLSIILGFFNFSLIPVIVLVLGIITGLLNLDMKHTGLVALIALLLAFSFVLAAFSFIPLDLFQVATNTQIFIATVSLFVGIKLVFVQEE